MDPLNKKERNQAILKMLLFFILAIIVVAVPMYYFFTLPEKEAAWNEEQYQDLMQRFNNYAEFEKKFLAKSDSALVLYEAYQNEEDEVARGKIQLRYSDATNQMEDFLKQITDDSVKVNLFNNVIFTYNNLFRAWTAKNEIQKELDACMQETQSKQRQISEKENIIEKQAEKVEQEESKSLQEKEIDLIKKALEKHNGSKRRAAEELGTTERKLRKRMKELGI